MKVIIFGATGMVGQGVLRECLLDPSITFVQTIGRSASGRQNPKLKELVHKDLWNYQDAESELKGFDACYFCLGTPSAGKKESEYSHVTYDLTMAAAEALVKLNPEMTFIYVSGEGADSSEKGFTMWARVRGKLENALLRLPFKAVYIFRPGVIQPLNGIQSKTKAYRIGYSLMKPILPTLRALFPKFISTTEIIGRAMIVATQNGSTKKILSNADINELANWHRYNDKTKT